MRTWKKSVHVDGIRPYGVSASNQVKLSILLSYLIDYLVKRPLNFLHLIGCNVVFSYYTCILCGINSIYLRMRFLSSLKK